MGLLGAHVPTAGGLANAPTNAAAIGCEAFQLFVKNPNRWAAAALTEADVARFRAAHREHGSRSAVAHASYLVNLAATNPETLAKSRAALADELRRCDALGVRGLVLHPGAHGGAGTQKGLDAVARSLDAVLAQTPGDAAVWLENTAGQGTVLGRTPQELGAILARCDHRARIGVCLDTCHAFAAGYPIHEVAGLAAWLEEVDVQVGLERLGCFHLNDAQCALGSRRDRHANIGAGKMGTEVFVRLLRDARFTATPMLLETPRGEDKLGHARDLARLRALVNRDAVPMAELTP
ncbi:deoxyribonuclease IV [Truepera radiovictrix]|uniref:Probable endonuclease 4 n=1 Tax=Truepera radiovictrix (strain DSM 17093 / CIP 108686 / LMG 22925 / RQ-24) TaxID=649638 RepID=D7CRS4_TRURR|nr:deoxyribonuclease IV [Truepera radiovictrix]ADI15252.1 apurinic endonuclease Apn1 [Truepera radiovictrix DSM 17093]WMT56196.1 deoxyribonuclease IV [Truepera radiovictrix]